MAVFLKYEHAKNYFLAGVFVILFVAEWSIDTAGISEKRKKVKRKGKVSEALSLH